MYTIQKTKKHQDPSQSCQQDLVDMLKSQGGMRTGGLPKLFPGGMNDIF